VRHHVILCLHRGLGSCERFQTPRQCRLSAFHFAFGNSIHVLRRKRKTENELESYE